LLKCYSSVCKDYYDIRHVLNSWEDYAANTSRSLSDLSLAPARDDDQQSEDGGIHIPIIRPPIKKPVEPDLESKLLKKFVHVFELASIVSIAFILLSSLCALSLLCMVLLRCCNCDQASADLPLLTRRKDNMILFVALFLLFLSTVSYIKITYRDLNGGNYVYGIWILTYTCMLGLICALISAIISMDEAASHRDGYRYELVMSSNNNSISNSSINPIVNGRRQDSEAENEDDQIELAAAPPYQYQASQV